MAGRTNKKGFYFVLIILTTAILAILVGMVGAASTRAEAAGTTAIDPRYDDVRRHWARKEIRVMRQEGVTDGRLFPTGARFYPDDAVRRDQFGMMMARVFGLDAAEGVSPSFRDLSPSDTFYGDKKPFGYIEAAYRRGLVTPVKNGRFYPKAHQRREDVFASLLRSLDLESWAERLPRSDVRRWLRRFRDHARIKPDLRQLLALGIHLGIIRGYPDRTLRPGKKLTRAEAAVILYRSALFRIRAVPDFFSPGESGVPDQTEFRLDLLRNRNMRRWKIEIRDRSGRYVNAFHRSRPRGPSDSVVWDGRNYRNARVPSGTYYYSGYLEDRRGNRYETVKKPVTIRYHRLGASLYPKRAVPGQKVEVTAWTRGHAGRVDLTHPRSSTSMRMISGKKPASDHDRNHWSLTFTVPKTAAPGTHRLRLRALYERTSRTKTLGFTVEHRIGLSGRLVPNPAAAGQKLTVEAETTGRVTAVSAVLPDYGRLPLRRTKGSGQWRRSVTLPLSLAEGTYPVPLRASGPDGERTITLSLGVEGNLLDSVAFHLTD